jgi:hypothetical protein
MGHLGALPRFIATGGSPGQEHATSQLQTVHAEAGGQGTASDPRVETHATWCVPSLSSKEISA